MNALVYLSPVPWASFAQRPHKFVEWFQSTRGGRVLWVDPYPTRLPHAGDIGRLVRRQPEPARATPPWMEVLKFRALPVEPLPGGTVLNTALWRSALQRIVNFSRESPCTLVIGKPSRLALQVLDAGTFGHTVYDAMDDFPAFYSGYSRSVMARTELAVARRVKALQVSASGLKDKFTPMSASVVLVRNACDPDSLPAVSSLASLHDSAVIGYVGTLGSWFDWGMVIGLARDNPAMTVRLIGPMLTPAPATLPANIELRPPCSHEVAMMEMARFAVGLIPFVRSRLTASVDPIKYYEYRALGVPVLASDFGEMPKHAREGGVWLIDAHTDRVEVVRQALGWHDDNGAILAFRERHSWKSRFSQDAEAALAPAVAA